MQTVTPPKSRPLSGIVMLVGVVAFICIGGGFLVMRLPKLEAMPAQALQAANTQALVIPQTATQAPTYAAPTVDYIATNVYLSSLADAAQSDAAQAQQQAIYAQQTAVEAQVEAAQIARDREALALAGRQLDAANTAAAYTATNQAAVYTATAFVPISTIEAAVLADRADQRAHEQAEPDRIKRLAQAQAFANWSPANGWFAAAYKILGLVALPALIVVAVVYILRRREPVFIEPEPDPEPRIPFVQHVDGDGRKTLRRAEVPVSLGVLILFAEGILRANRSTAFGQWRGTPVYKHLGELKKFFNDHGFGKPIEGREAEWDVTERGKSFLGHVLGREALPAGFDFVPGAGEENSPSLAQDTPQNGDMSRDDHQMTIITPGGGVPEGPERAGVADPDVENGA